MSKWYTAYTSIKNGVTYYSEDQQHTLEHAIDMGEFDEICGKESFMAHEEALFFEVAEEDLKNHEPYAKIIA